MPSIHPTAVVHPKAQLADDCKIGPYCVIGQHVVIGEGTEVGHGCHFVGKVKIASFDQRDPSLYDIFLELVGEREGKRFTHTGDLVSAPPVEVQGRQS